MRIDGYTDRFPDPGEVEGLLYDSSEMTSDRAFWAAHLLNQVLDDEELVMGVWGVADPELADMQDRLADPSRWPLIRVGLAGGASLFVVYRNLDEDAGVDYVLAPGSARAIRLATTEGSYEGPGISWRELVAASRHESDPLGQAGTLLLLSPMLGDREAEETGRDVVAEAIAALGGSGDVDGLAGQIVSENLQWEPAEWTADAEGVVICDDPASPRNPDGPAALSHEEMRAVSQLLAL